MNHTDTANAHDELSSAHKFCIAPMLDWSDTHARYFWRLISSKARLYTEMITTGAMLHGDTARHLAFSSAEQPLALQLGGSDPQALARCCELAEKWQYQEVNLNIGCPSDRVQNGRFGACLMAEPSLVGRCVREMQAATTLPVTVKCRIGIDDQDEETSLLNFIDIVADAGCTVFIVHARKAWLKGLSPKQNRDVPPLNYPLVYRARKQFPNLNIILNGGIETIADGRNHLAHVDGVMLGRAIYHNPYILSTVDNTIFGSNATIASRDNIFQRYLPYVEQQLEKGQRLQNLIPPILNLYHSCPGGRVFRRHISENAHKRTHIDVLKEAHQQLLAAREYSDRKASNI